MICDTGELCVLVVSRLISEKQEWRGLGPFFRVGKQSEDYHKAQLTEGMAE